MKKINIIIIILSFTLLFGCQSVQNSLTKQKKSSSDEFLVEKKSPLIMPPSYNELPKPNSEMELEGKNSEEEGIKSLITNKKSEINTDNKNSELKSSIEDTVLKKINNE